VNWLDALKLAGKNDDTFIKRGKKIVKRFRDERGAADTPSANEAGKRYNMLWSNVRTQFPAIYSKKPQAQVERRYKDQDPVARTASQILERALQYEIDHYSDFDSSLRCVILDRLLPGRGVAWIRFDAGDQITEDVPNGEEENEAVQEPGETLEASDIAGNPAAAPVPLTDMPPPAAGGLMGDAAPATPTPDLLQMLGMPAAPVKQNVKGYECTPSDYVFWEDFRCSPARTWEEVTWVARLVYMGRAEGKKRFGAKFDDVKLTHEPIGLDKDITVTDAMKKAKVWEIWDKTEGKVIWQAEGSNDPLDTKDDPLELDGFFPCPKPLFATTTTDTLIPVADYYEYQDQAQELDDLTGRISMLVKAVKAVGVYDASQPSIARLMQEGTDNVLIPVTSWAAFATVGGLSAAVQMLPLDTVVSTLNELYKARDICKQVIYEVTGLSDIIRGSSDPNETATAQGIKSNFASLRLKETQQDVSRFATDILSMKAQIMSSLYRAETLIEMSGIKQTEDAQHADAAIELLRNETMRNYRIEVAADSMVELDEQAEKQSRMEFLQAVGGFLKEAVQAGQTQPELAPLLGEMLMFAVRSFKAGRPIEAAFERFTQQMAQPQQPKPDPEAAKAQGAAQAAQVKAQADVEIEQARLQAKQAIADAQAAAQQQTDAMRQQMEERQHQAELDMKGRMAEMQAAFDAQQAERDMAFEKWKVEKENERALGVAEINKAATMSAEQNAAADQAARD
jgi:hypothetical protein